MSCSKYKLVKQHNPFRNKLIENLKLPMKTNEAQTFNDIDCQQFAIVLDYSSEQNSQTYKKGALVYQNYELHVQDNLQSNRKKLIIFNRKEYYQKKFKQVYYSSQLKVNPSKLVKELSSNSKYQQNDQQKTTKLLIYLSNSEQFSQQVILSHNQTQFFAQKNQKPQNLLSGIYRQLIEGKDKVQKSEIYFSAIGIKKQNQLYDFLNDFYLEIDIIDIKKVPLVRVRKIGSNIDSVSAQNLTRQKITSQSHFNSLMQKATWIKNKIGQFHNFSKSFFIGEIYHFYQVNQSDDILNEIVVLKINQSLLIDRIFQNGFQQRRMKENNASKVSTLLMRMGLKIKNCRKNITARPIEKQYLNQFLKMEMNESKILLYLSPLFCNSKTKYILINEIDINLALNEISKKLELNKSFSSHGNQQKPSSERSFLYLKHYSDDRNILSIVRKLALQHKPDLQIYNSKQSNRNSISSKFSCQLSKQTPKNLRSLSNQQLNFIDQKKKNLFSVQFSRQKSATTKNKSHTKYSQNIRSKSFFSQTIISAERNYLKFVDREHKKYQVEAQNNYYPKTVNERSQNFKFLEDNYSRSNRPQGKGFSYKRKMMVKRTQQLMTNYLAF